MLPQAFRNCDRDEGTHQSRTSFKEYFAGKLVTVFLGHIAEEGMDEGIREIGNTCKIKHDRFQAIPDAFDPKTTELVGKVPIGEKIAKFGEHVEFQFHKSNTLRGTRRNSFLSFPVRHYARIPTRPQSKFTHASVHEHRVRVKFVHADLGHGAGVHGRVICDLIPI